MLRLVEAVHFIDKHHRAPARCTHGRRALHRFANIFHATEHRRDRDELGIEAISHQPRERGLAHSRRAPQNHRMQPTRLERHAQRFARAEQFGLTDHLVERSRAQALGERCIAA